MYFIVGASVV
jgi:hypothetical protein